MTREAVTELGVRDLRTSLTRWLKIAQRGERIVVTINGRAVAQLGPIETDGPQTLDDLATVGLAVAPLDTSLRAAEHLDAGVLTATPADLRIDRLIDQIRGR